jgi:hypothetical protein
MKIEVQYYDQYINSIPQTGKHIIGQQKNDEIVVYQAYNNSIADFAITNQYFGGDSFSYKRMSWIKPNFLWMMYRCGWAKKHNQERVLAISLSLKNFETILEKAVYSSFQEKLYTSKEEWKLDLASKEVRLQWDPDHDPYGQKLERRAIQLGIKGSLLKKYGKEFIESIEDITPFVKEQKKLIDLKESKKLKVPKESVFYPKNNSVSKYLGIEEQD